MSLALTGRLGGALSRQPAPVTASPAASGDDWAETLERATPAE